MTKMIKIQKFKLSYFLNSIVKDINHFDSNDCVQARRYTIECDWIFEEKMTKMIKIQKFKLF